MSAEFQTVRARFALRFRCANCRKIMCRELVSPELEDAPADVEELLQSNLLNRQLYPCEECDNPVAVLIGVRQLGADEEFAADDEPEKTPAVSLGAKRVRTSDLLASRRQSLRHGVGRPAY